MTSFVLVPADQLPMEALADLAAEADSEGIRNVATLMARWEDGSERYDRRGELMLVAVDNASGKVIGVGGISLCPTVREALRVRRFYVAVESRRNGLARALAEQLIKRGFEFTTTLTCNARASAAAPKFWEAMGFHRVEVEGITHMRIAQST